MEGLLKLNVTHYLKSTSFFFFCKNSKTLSKFNSIVITTSVFFIIVNILDVKSNPCLAGCNLPLYYCGTFEGLGFHIYLEQNQI